MGKLTKDNTEPVENFFLDNLHEYTKFLKVALNEEKQVARLKKRYAEQLEYERTAESRIAERKRKLREIEILRKREAKKERTRLKNEKIKDRERRAKMEKKEKLQDYKQKRLERKVEERAKYMEEVALERERILLEKEIEHELAKLQRIQNRKKELNSKLPKSIDPQGRPRKNFDFETAKSIIQVENVGSVSEYAKWWAANMPAKMPKRPDRAYKSQWKGWPDFLGTTRGYIATTMNKGSHWKPNLDFLPYEEAQKFAISLNFKRKQQWLDWVNDGNCPKNIPRRPDLAYSRKIRGEKWISWAQFLGFTLTPEERVETLEPTLYIASSPKKINGVYLINVISGGVNAVLRHLKCMDVQVIAAFSIDNQDYKDILSKYNPYIYGERDEYLVNNIMDLIYDLNIKYKKIL